MPNQYTYSEPRLCSLDGCNNRHEGRGLCIKHLNRLKRNGDPLAGRTEVGAAIRFLVDSIELANEFDCIIWPFNLDQYGYGRLKLKGKDQLAHRLTLMLTNGLPPDDIHNLSLHDPLICTSKACINYFHLRWGSVQDNANDAWFHRQHFDD